MKTSRIRASIWVFAAATLATALSARADRAAKAVGAQIENFQVVVPGKIYRGAMPGDAGLDALVRGKVRTDLDLQGGDVLAGHALEAGESESDIQEEAFAAWSRGLRFLSIPLSSISPDTEGQDLEIDRALKALTNPSLQPVFVHCRHGSDRTGLVIALYRVLYQGCTPDQAHAEWMQYGHTRFFPWMDRYFFDKVQHDPRTHAVPPSSALCPLK